jgi:hypothetical protein
LFRLYGILDAHFVKDGDALGRGGFSLGCETSGLLFGSIGLRLSPWDDAGGYVSGHIALGVRDQ